MVYRVLTVVISVTIILVPIFANNPLYLTPLIDQNKTAEARNSSSVNSEIFINVRSYAGFLTVDERYNSNLFFWYFPNANKTLKDTPWIIWLQGGPGGSSLIGLFSEMGPFELVDDILQLRKYSWCKDFSMVFIDNPVGAGFSFTDREEGYPRNNDMYSENLYTAVKQLILLFPELGEAPLYIAGESYAGRYVPNMAIKIMKGNQMHNTINLKGLIMGNPILDRDSIVDYIRIFYDWGLVDSQGDLAVKPIQNELYQAVKDGNNVEADELRNRVLSELEEISYRRDSYNLLNDDVVTGVKTFVPFVTSQRVRTAIHVANQTFMFNNLKLHQYLLADFLAPVSSKIQILLQSYKILIYCGQLDLTTPCVLNAEGRRRKWRWSGRESFFKAPRVPWWLDDKVVGYVKSGGGLTEVLVTGAGHLAPADKPAELQQLITYFINGLDLPRPPSYTPDVNIPNYEEYTDLYYSANVSQITPGLIASIVVNVLLLIGIVVGGLLVCRWKRHYDILPFDDSVLTLT
ncbi:unnamed protein product, partial [Brenthis ino]